MYQQICTQKDEIRCKKRSRIYFDSKKKSLLIFGEKKWVLRIIHWFVVIGVISIENHVMNIKNDYLSIYSTVFTLAEYYVGEIKIGLC